MTVQLKEIQDAILLKQDTQAVKGKECLKVEQQKSKEIVMTTPMVQFMTDQGKQLSWSQQGQEATFNDHSLGPQEAIDIGSMLVITA